MNDHHEARLLLAVLREDWAAVERGLAERPLDPRKFLALCEACDVQPWVHARLAAEGRTQQLGVEVERRLAEHRRKCRADNLLLLARAEQALDVLAAAGVAPIALKGLDVLHRLYRFDERTSDDVDLLVRAQDVGRALDALEAAGWGSLPEEQRNHYLRSSHHLPLAGPGPVVVDFELHWSLVQAGRFRLDPDELFERAVPLEIAGRSIRRLEDHDFVAHLLLHHFTHYFDRRLKWVVDLRRAAGRPGFDWAVVARRIEAWGAKAAVGMSLVHLRKLFPTWIPDEIVRALPAARWRRALAAPLRSSHPLDLFRGTRRREIQLYLAAILLENPLHLPGWLAHRATRDRRPDLGPLAGGRRPGEDA